MQGAYPSGIFAGIKLERSVIKSQPGNGCSCGGSSVGCKRPVCHPPLYHIFISPSVFSPPTRRSCCLYNGSKSLENKFLYIQNGAAMLKWSVSHVYTARWICKYNTLTSQYHRRISQSPLPSFLPLCTSSPSPRAKKNLYKRKEKWKEERVFFFLPYPTLY